MKILESGENYLEMILILKDRLGDVKSIDIVNEMGFSKPSVSVAMKHLRENGYVCVDKKGYITLTDLGFGVASKVYERHRLLTKALILLGVSESVAMDDACRIEHHISQETFEKLKEYMDKH